MPTRSLRLAALLLVLAVAAAPASAAPQENVKALAAARAVIAKLPPPTPVISIDFRGDLLVAGLWSGETRYTAKAAKVGRQVVWRVTQDTYIDYAGAETRIRVMAHLKPDLSILSGSYERKDHGESVSLAFSRSGSGLLVQRRRQKGNADATTDLVEMKADLQSTVSLGALLLFLQAAPAKKGAVYALPWLSSAELLAPEKEGVGKPILLTIRGAGTWGAEENGEKKTRKTWIVACEHGETAFELHMTPDRKKLLGIRTPEGRGDIVPRGEGGERLTAKPDEPAATWKDAFLKFGFGYHLPRRSLLEAAFHWEDMYEHETKVLKRWDKSQPLSVFKQAWIDEFVNQSKHRSIHDTRRLLSLTLGTGKVKKQTRDEIVFAAHKNFGGGIQRTYHLRCKEGIWGIIRID